MNAAHREPAHRDPAHRERPDTSTSRRRSGEPDWSVRQGELAAAYISARPHLLAVAYAVLGSHAEAEDAVSECWLRLAATDEVEPIRDVEAWATVVVARVALDTLRSARVRREVYPGPWLPVRWPVIVTSTTTGHLA